MKTGELTDRALDWAVAKALNLNEEDYVEIDNLYGPIWRGPEYSTDWAQGGPIIEREKITLEWTGEDWMGYIRHDDEFFGPAPLIAAMRCFVASCLGDEIEIPDELINNEEQSK